MRVRYFLWRNRAWCTGWIVRYIDGDYAEIAPDGGGGRMYLYRNAVEGWEPLWER